MTLFVVGVVSLSEEEAQPQVAHIAAPVNLKKALSAPVTITDVFFHYVK